MATELDVTPKIGENAPDFALQDQNGKQVRLSQFRGKKMVLYFYPKDDTPGCTKEACAFRNDFSLYEKLDAVILGVSLDDEKSHQSFSRKYNLGFTLLSDIKGEVSRLYGVLGGWGPVKFANRTTFIIDSAGIIRGVFPHVKVDGHSSEILDLLAQIK